MGRPRLHEIARNGRAGPGGNGEGYFNGRKPARVTATRRRIAASDGRLWAAVRAWSQ